MRATADSAEVLTRVERGVGRITLNRPTVVNALTVAMVRTIGEALTRWDEDPSVRCIVLDGAGERGLCAGADVRVLGASAASGGADAREFFRVEYAVNAQIARYRKPYVALMDGIVMGGGVGVSSHGSIRVVTERTRLAMPEVTIGFVPDVGGTHLLSRAPGETGTHLALTGASVGAADAIWARLADYFVASERLPELVAALETTADPLSAVAAVSVDPPASTLEADSSWIDECYRFDSVPEILQALHDSGARAAAVAADTILTKSPTALTVTLESLRRARRMSTLEEALEQEYRVSTACLESADFVEGVRAQVIDKDRAPHWTPASLAEVSPATVSAFLEYRRYGCLRAEAQPGVY